MTVSPDLGYWSKHGWKLEVLQSGTESPWNQLEYMYRIDMTCPCGGLTCIPVSSEVPLSDDQVFQFARRVPEYSVVEHLARDSERANASA